MPQRPFRIAQFTLFTLWERRLHLFGGHYGFLPEPETGQHAPLAGSIATDGDNRGETGSEDECYDGDYGILPLHW